VFFFSSRRRHTRFSRDWSSDVCSSDLARPAGVCSQMAQSNIHSAWSPTGSWQGMFDCAIWLHTPAGLAHPVQLSLKYIDNGGEKIIHIDRCHPGTHRTVLLNGSFGLSVNGRVRDMGLYLLGITDPEIVVEEWHMTPQQRRSR